VEDIPMTSEMFYVSSKATHFHHLKKFLKAHKLPVASQSINFLLLLLLLLLLLEE